MRVMVVDGGSRGQAIAKKLAGESHEVFVSPGNPGNDLFAYGTGIPLVDLESQVAFAKKNQMDLTIPSSEDMLAAGIVDTFQEEDLAIFGPTKSQARIESDKNYAKEIARKSGVPIGEYAEFDDEEEAINHVRKTMPWPLFVKDNDLAQGKGVVRCGSMVDFVEAIEKIKGKVVIEKYVGGPEASLHSFCDGKTQLTVPFMIRDHKDLNGKMTGGMGTFAPVPPYGMRDAEALGEKFARPIVNELGFRGLLFSGLKGEKGDEKCLEYNARFGDPEAQVVLTRLKSELLPILIACVEGNLDELEAPLWSVKPVVCVVLAAHGYPDAPQKGQSIEGLRHAEEVDGVEVLHAGTKEIEGYLATNGGRVLNIIASAKNMEDARSKAYEAADKIAFNGKAPLMRRDIGQTALRG